MKPRKYLIRAIDYVNGKPHIGHALEYVNIDVLARYFRFAGFEVRMGVGTDEHGQKIQTAAANADKTTQEFCDQNAAVFQNLAKTLNITFDTFTRTSDPQHKEQCQTFWQEMVSVGDIYEKEYEGLYCVGCETFKQNKDLANGLCPDHQKTPEIVKEKNYFFKLSKYSDKIITWYEDNPELIFPTFRKTEIANVVKEGLFDISFSRSKEKLQWGVEVPGDDSQVMYVWSDALLNYITALGYPDDADFKKWWSDAEVIHVIGKDILRHHAAIWAGMLMSTGHKVPDRYFVHGHIMSGGMKMGKSLGNVIDPYEVFERYSTDAFRWFISREITAGQDGDMTWERFHEVYTGDLVNNIGNLFRRVLMLIEKYDCQSMEVSHFSEYKEVTLAKFHTSLSGYKMHEGTQLILETYQLANQYINDMEPWKLIKVDESAAKEVLWNLIDLIQWSLPLLEIFIPESVEKMEAQLAELKVGDILFDRVEL